MSDIVGPVSMFLKKARYSFVNRIPADVPCGECRLCCTGVYELSEVHPYEKAALGLPVDTPMLNEPGKPCQFLSETGCSVHSKRPAMCRIFDCRMQALMPPSLELRFGYSLPVQAYAQKRWKFLYQTEQDYVHYLAFLMELDRGSEAGLRAFAVLVEGLRHYVDRIGDAEKVWSSDREAISHNILYRGEYVGVVLKHFIGLDVAKDAYERDQAAFQELLDKTVNSAMAAFTLDQLRKILDDKEQMSALREQISGEMPFMSTADHR